MIAGIELVVLLGAILPPDGSTLPVLSRLGPSVVCSISTWSRTTGLQTIFPWPVYPTDTNRATSSNATVATRIVRTNDKGNMLFIGPGKYSPNSLKVNAIFCTGLDMPIVAQ